jgi:hypothetical protein
MKKLASLLFLLSFLPAFAQQRYPLYDTNKLTLSPTNLLSSNIFGLGNLSTAKGPNGQMTNILAATPSFTGVNVSGVATSATTKASSLIPLNSTATRAAVIGPDGIVTNALGTPNGSQFLRDDNTYATLAGGAGSTLQVALNNVLSNLQTMASFYWTNSQASAMALSNLVGNLNFYFTNGFALTVLSNLATGNLTVLTNLSTYTGAYATSDASTSTNLVIAGSAYPGATSVNSGGQLILSGGLSPARIAITNWNNLTNSITTNTFVTADGTFIRYSTNGAAAGMWTNGADLATCATNLATNINAGYFSGTSVAVSNYVAVQASTSNVLFYPLAKCLLITCGSVTNGATNLNSTVNATVIQPTSSGRVGIGGTTAPSQQLELFAGNVQVPQGQGYQWSGRSRLFCPADGSLSLNNNALSGFTRLTLGTNGTAAGGVDLWPSLDTTTIGRLNITDQSGVLNVPIMHAVRVLSKISSSGLKTNESFTYYDNSGSAGTVTNTLPCSTPGQECSFYVDNGAAFAINVLIPGSDTIRFGANTGTNLWSSTVGSFVSLYCPKTNKWIVTRVIPSTNVTWGLN